MPHDKSNSSLMSDKIDDRFVEVTIESNVRNLPDLDRTVLAGTGDDIVVVGTPLDVEYGGSMTGY